MEEERFYVLAFHSTSHSIQAEKKLKDQFPILIMPTPRELTNDCGLSIKFLSKNYEEIKAFISHLNIPCDLYSMSEKRINGKRTVKTVLSNSGKGAKS